MNQFILKLRILLLQNKLFYILFILFTIGSLLITNYVKYTSIYSINDNSFILKILSYKTDGNKLSMQLEDKEKLIGTYYFKSKEEKNNFLSSYSIGDYIKINGRLDIPKNNTIPNTFNYKKYLYNNKMFFILKINDFKLERKNKNIFYKLKNYVYKRTENITNNEYIYALVLGEISYIDSSVYDNFKSNGISHLFALSGLHVSLLSFILLKIINKLLNIFNVSKEEKLFPYLIVIFFLILYSFITGFKPSLLKAIFLFFLLGINKVYYFNIRSYNILIVVYCLLILINPFYIYDISFQLSLLITFFILYSSYYLKVTGYFKKMVFSSLISLFSSFPIIINNFYTINIFSIINNLFFIPLVSIFIYPLTLLTLIFPFFEFILNIFINILEFVSLKVNLIKIFNINFPKINLILVIVYYVLFIIIIKNKNKLKYIVLIIILLLYSHYQNSFIKDTKLYFIDVGQGDSALIITPHKKTILIDTGGYLKYYEESWAKKNREFNLMTSSLIPFFKSISVGKIDYLFLSHADEDHAGYSIDLVDNFKVNNVIINNGEISYIEKQLNYQKIKKYYNIDNIKIYSLNNKIYSNENDNSLILLLIIENKKILFMGDASIKEEKQIIKDYNLEDIFILKVGHHGSKTSTCEQFIEYINPKYSIISVGEDNKFGHPNKEVLKILKDSKIYRTDKEGSVEIKLNKNGYKIKTYSP